VRRIALATALVASLIVGLVAFGSGAQGASDYRVDALFDTAKGLIPGQLVKIAGARAGKIKDLVLQPDAKGRYRARVEMTVDGKFAPFRQNATCNIQPEGLISENFVQCDPGTPNTPELTPQGGKAPTVALKNTSAFIALTDLFDIWRTPIRQRFTLIISTLGLGTAGRGQDFNALLRRANPTLALVRKATGILNRQRSQVASIITATDRIMAELAKRAPRVNDFIDQAGRVTKQAADHKTQLAESIRRLPALLAAAKPALANLDTLTNDGTPVLRDLRASAPAFDRAVRELGPFADAARPALKKLGGAAVVGRSTAKHFAPTAGRLRKLGDVANTTITTALPFFKSLRDSGVIEGLMTFIYDVAGDLSGFDSISHILNLTVVENSCSVYATTPTPGCNATWAPDAAVPRSTRKTTSPKTPSVLKRPLLPAIRQPALPTPKLPLPKTLDGPVQKILDTVLGGGQTSNRSDHGLLDFLLK
jgi:ABC-type transporter Mla subunit MlaD